MKKGIIVTGTTLFRGVIRLTLLIVLFCHVCVCHAKDVKGVITYIDGDKTDVLVRVPQRFFSEKMSIYFAQCGLDLLDSEGKPFKYLPWEVETIEFDYLGENYKFRPVRIINYKGKSFITNGIEVTPIKRNGVDEIYLNYRLEYKGACSLYSYKYFPEYAIGVRKDFYFYKKGQELFRVKQLYFKRYLKWRRGKKRLAKFFNDCQPLANKILKGYPIKNPCFEIAKFYDLNCADQK
jgi:hypothetical protein